MIWPADRPETTLTAIAVAISVMAIVTLTVVTKSLQNSAAAVLQIGRADFVVAQKGSPGILDSVVTDTQVSGVAVDRTTYRIVGLYSLQQVFGDTASMLPLIAMQAQERKPGTVTLIAVQVRQGAVVDQVRKGIETEYPNLATVRLASEFGRVDRNMEFLAAARTGATMLALLIGTIIVAGRPGGAGVMVTHDQAVAARAGRTVTLVGGRLLPPAESDRSDSLS
ncbi:MAG: hypothetical protein KGQ66_02715 [Acidobacteriota bacterium]|nr:hypothetical protein [Acidobacteriota bacterium]